jgi:hypothetical protein
VVSGPRTELKAGPTVEAFRNKARGRVDEVTGPADAGTTLAGRAREVAGWRVSRAAGREGDWWARSGRRARSAGSIGGLELRLRARSRAWGG